MENLVKNFAFIILLAVFFVSCGGNSAIKEADTNSSNVSESEDQKLSETEIRTFLKSTQGTYGWETESDKIMMDFFDDGRLALQGPDGEATMWEGTWSLSGDQLRMQCKEINKDETVTVKIEGGNLVLGIKTYKRNAAAN